MPIIHKAIIFINYTTPQPSVFGGKPKYARNYYVLTVKLCITCVCVCVCVRVCMCLGGYSEPQPNTLSGACVRAYEGRGSVWVCICA